jgi:glutathione synthase
MAYITATHMLEHIHPATLVVNDPVEVRNAPEKLFVSHFGNLMPPTLISADGGEIAAFRAEHKDIIVKPLFGNGGAGVFHLGPDDENLSALIEMFTTQSREPIIVQRYLPQIRKGDKRIILIDGEAAGGLIRVPAAGEARANLHAGASAERADLTARERQICARIGPALKKRGLIFAGIDVIGDYLTEINVTSPTGLQEINRFDGLTGGDTLEARIWDAIEKRHKETR